MNYLYTTPIGFAHGVRYRDAMLRAWMRRTGCKNSYKSKDVPFDIPTNEERSRAEVIEFELRPVKAGESYTAYLTSMKPEHEAIAYKTLGITRVPHGVIATWMGEPLAFVTRITSYRPVVFGRSTTGEAGSFWAIGIDGRTYYGRHNGRGMYCRMRLAKWADEFDVEQHTTAGWEVVTSASTRAAARANVTDYRNNQPEFAVRIKHRKVRQT